MMSTNVKVLAILQARTGSKRLPNKVLLPIAGKPMLYWQVQRLLKIKGIDQLVIATSDQPEDAAIAELAQMAGVACFRGNEKDVLDRFYQCAKPYQPAHVVRFTGDCPLIDPQISQQVIQLHLQGQADYTSNCLPPTFPDGLDTEVFTFAALERAWQEAKAHYEREHVTPYINETGLFSVGNYTNTTDLSALRWTVDNQEDFALISQIFQHFAGREADFSMMEVINFLKEKPELADINKHIQRNEGYIKEVN